MWIKRSEYENLQKIRNEYEDIMSAMYRANSGAITYFKFGVFMPSNICNAYTDHINDLNKEANDLKEKVLQLEASRDYYKHKYGELMEE